VVGGEAEDPGDGRFGDAEIVRQSLHRPDRFGLIFDRHADAVHRFLWRRAGPTPADELLGDVFCIAFERRAGFRFDRSSARPWLYGIATHQLQHWWRSRARADAAYRRVAASEILSVDGDADLDAVIARLDAAGASAMLRAFLASLPADRVDLLVLWACEQLTYPELAEALDLPIGTVRSRIHRLRSAAMELMTRDRESDGVTADVLSIPEVKGPRP
jgi:RNA polymerase sigma factor (sigma-70 family)